jgi:hypothetical protein
MNMRTQSWRLKDGIGYKVDERGLTVRLRLQNLFVRYSTVYTAKMTSEIRQDRNNTAISMQPSELLFNIVVNLNTLHRLQQLTGLLSSIWANCNGSIVWKNKGC